MASPPPTDSGDLASVTTPAGVAPIADRRRSFGSSLLKTTPAWLVSLLAHVVVLLTMAVVLANLAADLIYPRLDPRVVLQ